MKMGWIPLAPIRRILLAWELKQEYDETNSFHYQGRQNMILPLAPITCLAGYIGIDVDTLWSIRGRQAKSWVDFDVADKIITYIDPSLWRNDSELKSIYENFDFSSLDARRPPMRELEAA